MLNEETTMTLGGIYVCPTCSMEHHGKTSQPYYCVGKDGEKHAPAAIVKTHHATDHGLVPVEAPV